MTLRELYRQIGGDYDQALRVMRVEKLIDKHIRKLTQSGVVDRLLAAGETMDATALFETAHAVKGVCGNLWAADAGGSGLRNRRGIPPGQSPQADRRAGEGETGKPVAALQPSVGGHPPVRGGRMRLCAWDSAACPAQGHAAGFELTGKGRVGIITIVK